MIELVRSHAVDTCSNLSQLSSSFLLNLSDVDPEFTEIAGQSERFTSVPVLVNKLLHIQKNGDPQAKRVALVFGREVEGLLPDEIQICDAVCSIPIGRLQESLSLSHAVSIVLSQLYEAHTSIFTSRQETTS